MGTAAHIVPPVLWRWGAVGFVSALFTGEAVAAGLGRIFSGARNLLSGVRKIAPTSIRFSQTSVNGAAELIGSMTRSGWKGDPIDVVRMGDGLLTTVDNTRVLAASITGTKVNALVHTLDEPIIGHVGRFAQDGIMASTWGEAVLFRIAAQNKTYRSRYPNASSITGWKGN